MAKKKKSLKIKHVTRERVFNYISLCCDKPARKPPIQRSEVDRAENKYSECGLGKWTCSQCEKHCKVKRIRIKETDDKPSETGTEDSK